MSVGKMNRDSTEFNKYKELNLTVYFEANTLFLDISFYFSTFCYNTVCTHENKLNTAYLALGRHAFRNRIIVHI